MMIGAERLNVAVVVNELNVRGGTHKQVHRLAEYLLCRGHKCTVFTYAFNPERCFPGIQKITVREVGSFNGLRGLRPSLLANLRRCVAMVTAIPKDTQIINLHDFSLYGVAILAKWLRPRAKVVWQINDLHPAFGKGVFSRYKANLLDLAKRTLFRFAARSVASVTVNVGKNRDLILSELGVKAELFYCGVDMRRREQPPRPARSLPIRLVSTGVLFPYRNYETLLKVQTVLEERYDLPSEVTIVGAADLYPAYGQKIQKMIEQGARNARISGEVTEAELDRIYTAAHFFLFLNIDQSWGLAVFEAMNYGIPVIVSKSVGATELLHDGVDSVIVDPMDAERIAECISALWSDDALSSRLSSDAFKAVDTMTWDSMYSEKVEMLFSSLLKTRSCDLQLKSPRSKV